MGKIQGKITQAQAIYRCLDGNKLWYTRMHEEQSDVSTRSDWYVTKKGKKKFKSFQQTVE